MASMLQTTLCLSVLLGLLTPLHAELSVKEMDTMEDLNIQSMLQEDIRVEEAKARPRGRHFDTHKMEIKAKNYSHPIFRPGLVDEIRYSYRKYREMILVKAGSFWMGTNDPESITGEYPMRQVKVKSFYLDANPVINADYWVFRMQKKFVRSDAERKGWSWVPQLFLSNATRLNFSTTGPTGWMAVKKAHWDAPEGPDSNLMDRWKHPVTHLSWHDARQYCQFHGRRLPTEAEWEFAARAGVTNRAYPWGDNWERQRANVWQGKWPLENKKADGYSNTSPVDAYPPQNLIGFYDLIGNVWEWTGSSYVERGVDASLQPKMVSLKGGSLLDSVNGRVNLPVRCGQRMGQKQDYTASNVGFRCARSAPEFDMPTLDKRTSDKAKEGMRKKRKFHRRKEEL